MISRANRGKWRIFGPKDPKDLECIGSTLMEILIRVKKASPKLSHIILNLNSLEVRLNIYGLRRASKFISII